MPQRSRMETRRKKCHKIQSKQSLTFGVKQFRVIAIHFGVVVLEQFMRIVAVVIMVGTRTAAAVPGHCTATACPQLMAPVAFHRH